jgi:hypothetical protein
MTDDSTKTGRSITGRTGLGRTTLFLLLVGLGLFLFPEPFTSLAGMLLILIGVGSWLLG